MKVRSRVRDLLPGYVIEEGDAGGGERRYFLVTERIRKPGAAYTSVVGVQEVEKAHWWGGWKIKGETRELTDVDREVIIVDTIGDWEKKR
jgi:hypothetical protein